MNDDSDRLRRERQLAERMAACRRTLAAAMTELQGMQRRVGSVSDEVMGTIGGTTQGSDIDMVTSLTRASSTIESGLLSCAQAQNLVRTAGG